MPKKVDPALKERTVRLVREHRVEHPSKAKAENVRQLTLASASLGTI
ncbi:MAG: hypothetical protein QM611_06760 [Microbacterium sp.]